MARRKNARTAATSSPDSLVPMEPLVVGAWVTLVIAAWAFAGNALPRHHTALAETLLGVFLLTLVMRRGARGLALLVPFAALTLAVVSGVVLLPEMRDLQLAGLSDRAQLVRSACALVDLGKVVLLYLFFQRSFYSAHGA